MFKSEQLEVIEYILHFESLISPQFSDDYTKYLNLGLEIGPNNPSMLMSHGLALMSSQYTKRFENPSEVDYSYIDIFKKANKNEIWNFRRKQSLVNFVQYATVHRDYYLGLFKQINHLIQFDTRPNLAIVEPQWEIYKITISYLFKGFNP